MGSGGFVGVGIEWETSGMGFEEFVGVGQIGCGGFEELVLGNFRDGSDGFEEWVLGNFKDGCGGMLKSVWVATVGKSGLGIARSGLASSELGLSNMEGMRSGGGEEKP
nr:hypothetical protein CFP56_41127 [Quercus suber]